MYQIEQRFLSNFKFSMHKHYLVIQNHSHVHWDFNKIILYELYIKIMYFIFKQKLTGDTLSLQMVTFLEKAVLINSTYIY